MIYAYDESASVKIVEILLNHKIRIESAITRFEVFHNYFSLRAIRRSLGLLRDEIMYLLKPNSNPPQSKSIPKGIRRKDIKVGLMAEDHFSKVQIRKIGINLWEFDISN